MKEQITRVPMLGSNAYLLRGEKGFVLVDVGRPGATDRVKEAVKGQGAEITDIQLIVITHVHQDHVGSLARIKREASAEVLVHESEAHLLRNGVCGFPRGTTVFSRAISSLANRFMDGSFEPVEPELLIGKRFGLNRWGIDGEILHAPGHTEGSIVLMVGDEICIAGDTFFNVFPGSVYPPFADDEQKLLDSWKMIRERGCKKYYPGHGKSFDNEKFTKSFHKRV